MEIGCGSQTHSILDGNWMDHRPTQFWIEIGRVLDPNEFWIEIGWIQDSG
jgi:hypothetical protein